MEKNKEKEIKKAVENAITKGRYLIMITSLEENKLHHFTFTEKFPINDIIPSARVHLKMIMEGGGLNQLSSIDSCG